VPSTLTKKKLTVAEAADQWERAKRTIVEQKPLLEEAEEILKAHFEKTGRNTYKDRIALNESSRLILDQPKVRAYLGKKLGDFQKRVESKTLALLK